MKNRYRNLFLLFGTLAIVIMLCTMDMDYSDIWENVKRIGFWFPVIMLLWFFVYLINTCSWYLIIRDDRQYDAHLFSLLVLVSLHILIYLPVSCEYLYGNIAHCNRGILSVGYLFLYPWI